MTVKKRIYKALTKLTPKVLVAYAYTDKDVYPRIIFTNIVNPSRRYSSQRHSQKFIYQIDYFSRRPLDIETNEHLAKLIRYLEEEGLTVGDWRERYEFDKDNNRSIFHYWLEVSDFGSIRV